MMEFRIMKLRDGGYIVCHQSDYMMRDAGGFSPPVFASAKIAEALEYIRERFDHPEQSKT
jgi:hypothetical protein